MESLQSIREWLRAQEQKELVRFVTIGSVDDGKSTLIGRLLHDAQGLYQDQLDAVRRASLKGSTRSQSSASEIDFSLFTDGLLAEREQGITIDVAYRYFATGRRKFIIADTPGHVQYTRNMATGASTADAAVILIDARLGVLEQTRRHARIAALLGIPHVIACVNKMDLVAFEQARFDAIAKDLEVVRVEAGLTKLHPMPVSALAGDNIVDPSTRMPWWTGGTLLEHLDHLEARRINANASFRFPVQLVLRPGVEYRGYAGQIASGSISVNDEIVVLPSGKRSRVTGIDLAGASVPQAVAPASIALRLADEIDISRGDLLVRPNELPLESADAEAHLVWMSERPLDRNRAYLIKHTTRAVRATIAATNALALNAIERVTLHCRSPLSFDPYQVNAATGAFIVIDAISNDTVAAGMLIGKAEATARSRVTDSERETRLGQRGTVLFVGAATLERARALAFDVERKLFDEGQVAAVVEEQAADACARAGVIALVPAVGEELSVSENLRLCRSS